LELNVTFLLSEILCSSCTRGSDRAAASGEQSFVIACRVELSTAVPRYEDDIFKVRTTDIRPIRQDDPRLQAHHHVLYDFKIGVLIDQRLAMQAIPELVAGVAAIEIFAPAGIFDDLARSCMA
jgi:hypothetical protein